ncbi:hypothetical protein [Kineosporia sp. A_224]|uniref:hypothetical protein n=1 Tax=Kineosporia sp. A_224 TaxID=1962180 RepID=UPI000B4B4E84|nr:hypothetical protein [Kineosporia sp. A_224]
MAAEVPRPLRTHLTRGTVLAAAVPLVALSLAACTPTDSSSTSKSSSKSRSKSSTSTVVVISAADDVCWTATVDGKKHKGCGDAEFTDRKGGKSATVVKTSDGSRVGVKLVVRGKTVDRGSVWRRDHSAEVAADG